MYVLMTYWYVALGCKIIILLCLTHGCEGGQKQWDSLGKVNENISL